jgi:Mrp family chromosome partitioning ATPase
MVVANVALAIAEGTHALVVDADADGDLTARLLPGIPAADGLEQVIAGQRALPNCTRPSRLNGALGVLGPGWAAPHRVTGRARSKAVGELLAEAKEAVGLVLIDSPALLQVADAVELVGASDAVIIVLSPNELIRDHLEMVDRLNLIGVDVVGCIYNRAPMRPRFARHRHDRSSAHPAGRPAAPHPALAGARPADAENGSSSQPQAAQSSRGPDR